MFTVVICGRPNVGKSTLFNRLSGKKRALTYPVAGTTRDVIEIECFWQNKIFTLVDTGGIEIKTKEELAQEIQRQINLALAQADLILFLVDGKQGLDKNDFFIASKLRKLVSSKVKKLKKPVLLAVNKIDSKKQEEIVFQFYKLGFGAPFPISAQTGKGCGDFLDKIVLEIEKFPKQPRACRGVSLEKLEEKEKPIKVGIFGRQNVGKSSLLNCLLGKTRVLVSEIPGTTRDTIDTLISHQNQKIILVDTAGIKRKSKIELGVEKFSIKKSLKTIEKCDIALLALDAQEGITRQDFRLLSQILKNKKGLILVINKWDIIEAEASARKEKIEKHIDFFQKRLSSFFWTPQVFTSAKLGKNVKPLLDLILQVAKERNRILTKAELEDFFISIIKKSPPPKMKLKKQPKIQEFLQERIAPPKFVLILGQKEIIPPFYFRFLEKELRKKFGFFGTPIEIMVHSQ